MLVNLCHFLFKHYFSLTNPFFFFVPDCLPDSVRLRIALDFGIGNRLASSRRAAMRRIFHNGPVRSSVDTRTGDGNYPCILIDIYNKICDLK